MIYRDNSTLKPSIPDNISFGEELRRKTENNTFRLRCEEYIDGSRGYAID